MHIKLEEWDILNICVVDSHGIAHNVRLRGDQLRLMSLESNCYPHPPDGIFLTCKERSLVEEGEIIEAIKSVRTRTNQTLLWAKSIVELYQRAYFRTSCLGGGGHWVLNRPK